MVLGHEGVGIGLAFELAPFVIHYRIRGGGGHRRRPRMTQGWISPQNQVSASTQSLPDPPQPWLTWNQRS